MPKCTVTRTHRRGQPLRDRDFDPPVAGAVNMASVMDEALKRVTDRLTIDRMTRDGGMVDIHDKRPMCLTVDDALAWLDPTLPANEALELLSTPRPESAFQWWQVTRAMGNSKYQLPDASASIG